MKHEHRATKLAELRVADGDAPTISGYAAVYDSPTDIGGFREVVMPGAFDASLARNDDVRALVGHDPDKILGRNKAGTLEMRSDERGLAVTISPPDTQVGRDVVESIKRGDLDGMSFGFMVDAEEWRDAGDLRELHAVSLFDVSVVTYPAYQDTTVATRSRDTWRQHQHGVTLARARVDLGRLWQLR